MSEISKQTFMMPPLIYTEDNKPRHTGFEIEFSGLKPKETAALIVQTFGGYMHTVSDYIIEVRDTPYGTFSVYLDYTYLRTMEFKKSLLKLGFDEDEKELSEFVEDFLVSISETVVPYEITTPPIPFNDIQKIEVLKEAMRKKGALGTKASLFYAFGMHINIQTPSFKAGIILDILRAFIILYEWIKEKSEVDLTRKLTFYIAPFKRDYMLLILDKDYNPGISRLIDDYIFYNPTRKRALDLLPLFAYLDRDRVFSIDELKNQKILPRPAFHYRLPNSRIDEKEWSIAKEWNYWVEVEKLAFNKEKLAFMSAEYRSFLDSPLYLLTPLWVKKVDEWLVA
ncbi:amidoligase family protein [Nitrosophilus alvini]|uniref:amidoligase family protein n=1 Tax=Nitrosophilus alvini TaxID=2714855 RepID=UPI00190D7C7A|nr:amidoligase family protein [Nitrosophilus alvini]